ncbi:MAG TPA: CHAD domain-containing protein [Acidimicrobiia bacterium]|jgi:CHAD domain-containing protein
MTETEVKVSFDALLSLGIADVVDGLGHCTIDAVDQEATYFDTERLALTRAGASLRYRSDDGWTVKLPGQSTDRALVRDEYTIGGEEGEPPSGAVDLVRAWIRSDALVPIAYLHTHRQRAVIDDSEGAAVEVVVDAVHGRAMASGHSTRFLEAEVESKRDNVADAVGKAVQRLEALGGDARAPQTKVARVLGSAASAPADVAEARLLRRDASLEDVVRAAITTGTRRLIEYDAAVRLDTDIEGVHHARTTVRRLRANLRTFRPWLDREWCESLRAELRWLGAELGRVRDADVLLDSLSTKAHTLPSDERLRADVLLTRLDAMRRRDFEVLLEAMRSDRYVTLLDQLVDAANAPRTRPRMPARGARRAARHVARRQSRGMRKGVRSLSSTPSDSDLHELRKRAKKARYALEAVAPILGKKADRAADALADLQDVLGAHQDAVVAIAWLSDAARDSDTQPIAFAAGRLAARYELDMVDARRTWQSQWARAKRRLSTVSA